jgi:hypothetical protein
MRDIVIKQLERFLEIANGLDSPFKFYSEEIGSEMARAWIWMGTLIISWEGPTSDKVRFKLKLQEHGFAEAEERESKKFMEDLM